jgi:hypothetical protein
MILVRTIFQAKFGKGGELAQAMAGGMRDPSTPTPSGAQGWRLLTDLSSGPFDTVVLEGVWESLAAWEQARVQMFSDPSFQEGMRGTAELIESGRSELYTIEAAGSA